jgi:hypothetical protein
MRHSRSFANQGNKGSQTAWSHIKPGININGNDGILYSLFLANDEDEIFEVTHSITATDFTCAQTFMPTASPSSATARWVTLANTHVAPHCNRTKACDGCASAWMASMRADMWF